METIIDYTTTTVPLVDLLGTLVPDIQRAKTPEQINEMYRDGLLFYDTHGKYLTPGKISIAIVGDSEKYIIDGQHRMEVYMRLAKEFPLRPLFVTIDQYRVATTGDMEVLYKFVNKCIPNEITRLALDKYKVVKHLTDWVSTRWPGHVKTSENPQSPNINIQKLTNAVVAMNHNLTGPELVSRAEALNNFYAKTIGQFKKWHVKPPRRPSTFYLGYWRAYEWVERLVIEDPGTVEHYASTHRPQITFQLRQRVWGDPTKGTQPCFCCGATILQMEFHCGHVTPVCRGGPTTLDNLRPVCPKCNINMGTANLLDYKARVLAQQI